MSGFTADDAARANHALREALGLGPEAFPVQAFVGMISDEVDQLRASGRSDADIAAILQAAGINLHEDDIGRYYAPPEERRRG